MRTREEGEKLEEWWPSSPSAPFYSSLGHMGLCPICVISKFRRHCAIRIIIARPIGQFSSGYVVCFGKRFRACRRLQFGM
jgi:hypothetical protein